MDSFKTLQKLGKGTFGTVYLCERKHNGQKIVIKEIQMDLDSNQMQASKNEVGILKSLKHPNIIKYHDSFIKKSIFYIVMEYARYGNLHEFISKNKPQLLPKQRVLSMFCQLVMGVTHIHSKKIIHRDLKSENIFLTGNNATIIKIGDFGISKALSRNNNTTNTVIGTTNYIAPEICEGLSYDTKSDIWSLGCILFELCAMERLFEGSIGNIVTSIQSANKKRINVQIYGEHIERIIDSVIQINPDARPTALGLLSDPLIFPVHAELILSLGCPE